MVNIFRSNSQASKEVISYRLLGRISTWLTAMELLELGMVDVVLETVNAKK
jgi:ATP-dependent protease ClpP protease subunit